MLTQTKCSIDFKLCVFYENHLKVVLDEIDFNDAISQI